MRFWKRLRQFNALAFALVSLMAIALLVILLASNFQDWRTRQKQEAAFKVDDRYGLQIDGGTRKLTLYAIGDPVDEFHHDLKFVDARDGAVTTLSNDENARFYNGTVVSPPDSDRMDSGYGYFVLEQVGQIDGKPLLDAIFLRFSDMKQIRFANKVLAVDGPQELDESSFSAVVWDAKDGSKFVLFDSLQGRVVVERDLSFDRPAPIAKAQQAAPTNKFH